MGKHAVGTPKWISNRIKSKGLQKLRWFCQMCQKQCRDENGFKCHTSSEAHQRQLLLFAENPDEYLDTFSRDFEAAYLEVLRRRFGTKRVHANVVYQEFIGDKMHVHMNSTTWETLTEFVKYLGRAGKCTVDETEKGWFVAYIDRNPEALAKQEAHEKKEKLAKDDQERMAEFIERQVERAKEQTTADGGGSCEYTELKRTDDGGAIQLQLKLAPKEGASDAAEAKNTPKTLPFKNVLARCSSKTDSTGAGKCSAKTATASDAKKRKLSTLDEIRQAEEQRKEKQNRADYWLAENIVVKVTTRELGDSYYRQKAVVRRLIDPYTAVVRLLDGGGCGGGGKLRLDQTHVETVVPAAGRRVLLVNGAYRGHTATLDSIEQRSFSATLTIDKGPNTGRRLVGVAYEDFSKLYVEPS